MSLDELLETAYRRGTGVSRRYAASSARVRELAKGKELKGVALEKVHIQYLGERLSSAAFKQLPKRFRAIAEQWSQLSTGQQFDGLQEMTNSLKSRAWLRRRNLAFDRKRYGSPESVLPLQYGSWTHGSTLPNCLGMAQMLMGFAQKTGAAYLLVTAVTRGDEWREMFLNARNREIANILSRHIDKPLAQWLFRFTERFHRNSLRILQGQDELATAHHALLIRLRSNEWYMVDPYMGVCARVRDIEQTRRFNHQVYRRLRGKPGASAVTTSDLNGPAMIAYINKLQRVFQRILRADDGSVDSISRALKDWSKLMFETDLAAALTVERQVWLGRNRIRQLRADKASPEVFVREVREAKRRARRNKRERHKMQRRAIQLVFAELAYLTYAISDMETGHAVYELTDPDFGLAVATLHHLAVKSGTVEPELLRYSGSQFIIRDVLDSIKISDTDPLWKVLEKRLDKWQKLPNPEFTHVTFKHHLQQKEA